MRIIYERPDSPARTLFLMSNEMSCIKTDITPLHKNTKPFWRFLVMQNAWHYLRDRKQGATDGTQWAGKFGGVITFDYVAILKNIRYCRPKQFRRFQKFPEHQKHIYNLKWRLRDFKRGIYDPKNINSCLLSETNYY